ncbi:hypothetical protein J3R83DRAFT_1256 [Lanmaoa asiatica]|nr:hypothetical protein J3R83DRAFT_1256 [Lanmaoa asiatica]
MALEANKSNRYYWKCNHCGDLEGSKGSKIQGRDNNLPLHTAETCSKATPELRQEARAFIFTKGQLTAAPKSSESGTIWPLYHLE